MIGRGFNRRDFLASALACGVFSQGSALAKVTGKFYAPHEGAPHARTWMSWPSDAEIYGGPSGYFEEVEQALGRLAARIADFEPVSLLAEASMHPRVRALCGSKVDLVDIATDDMWARDSGPVFVTNQSGEKGLVDFNFNGWGGKQRHAKDGAIARQIAERLGLPLIKTDLVGEGGGVEYDGDGTLILTESCWINDNRNSGMSKAEIEAELKALLGVEKVIWLPGVKGRDITDGHIDGFLRIVRPGVLLMGYYPSDGASVWAKARQKAEDILNKATDARGRSFEIVKVASATRPRCNSPDLFTGYANYYVANGAVITPEFGDDDADANAMKALGALYPERQIVPLSVDRIYENGGGIHCVTQQEPAG